MVLFYFLRALLFQGSLPPKVRKECLGDLMGTYHITLSLSHKALHGGLQNNLFSRFGFEKIDLRWIG